jgi:DNA recombination protein RmuC
MVEHCDFVEQHTIHTDEGRLRPDLVVRLPGRKAVVVDSKAPLAAYLDAMDATDERQRELHLDCHARQVRDHVEALAQRDYADHVAEAPDFVVLFLPGEAFFSAACQRDPGLLEFAVTRGVIPASPTTLITILKAVAYGWQQERIAENAEQIRDLGQELYERMRTLGGHLAKMRAGLGKALESYNDAIGSIEGRVLPTARKFRDLGAGPGEEIASLERIDIMPRLPAAAESLLEVEPIVSRPISAVTE